MGFSGITRVAALLPTGLRTMTSRHLQAQLPHVKVHAYFAPVTPPPAVGGGGQRLCRCCVIL